MSTQLTALGIEFVEGYAADQLNLQPDVVVVGNALSRGSPVIEAMLDRGMAYTSGPAVARRAGAARQARAGGGRDARQDHDREHAGVDLGARRARAGIPHRRRAEQFRGDRAPGRWSWFVIEADEYDTAFFDKRAKFVHYRPRTAILNNLEYDHADIYPDVASIRRQFNQLLRTVPARGTAHRQRRRCGACRHLAGGLLDAPGNVQPVERRGGVERRRVPDLGVARVHGAAAAQAGGAGGVAAPRHAQRHERAGGHRRGRARGGRARECGAARCANFAASSAAWRFEGWSAGSRCTMTLRIIRPRSRRRCAACGPARRMRGSSRSSNRAPTR